MLTSRRCLYNVARLVQNFLVAFNPLRGRLYLATAAIQEMIFLYNKPSYKNIYVYLATLFSNQFSF